MGDNAVGLNNNVAGHTDKRFETAVDAYTPSSQYTIFNIIKLYSRLAQITQLMCSQHIPQDQ